MLLFNGGSLVDANQTALWGAKSGPWGKGAAPKGLYYMTACFKWSDPDPPYTDAEGFCWFASIEPMFPTERSGFGIHPDGNVPGTRGCIGITTPDSKPCYNFLRAAESVYVVVM